MRYLLVIVLIIGYVQQKDPVKNSIWTCKVSERATDTLWFKSNHQVDDYDCEMRYTFRGSYVVRKDTIIVIEKDDSHTEDSGKVSYYRESFRNKKNVLYPLMIENLIGNKWVKAKRQMDANYLFKRIK